ncbi:hypothetical protein ST47_g2197 [Ascochyta rabiei]|uniref:Uncharacterized protein n=1 Tax=Didymella rabiei TaxID=5454 RepID=A0A163JY15_DIDRA|nr:hypothetical protein ST47_g2197 [Ascochyta rabiei]
MAHITQGYSIETPSLHEQIDRTGIFKGGSDLESKNPAVARKLSEVSELSKSLASPAGDDIPSPPMNIDSDEHHAAPAAPRLRDYMDLAGDWEPDEGSEKDASSDSRQESSQGASDAYQRHIRDMMARLNTRMDGLVQSPPGDRAAEERESSGSVDQKRKGKAKVIEKRGGHDEDL